MAYNIRQQLPYVLTTIVLTYIYYYGIDGSLDLIKSLATIPVLFIAFWLYGKFATRGDSFSIAECFKKHGHIIAMLGLICAYSDYVQHKSFNVIHIGLIYICIIMSVLLLERSLYE